MLKKSDWRMIAIALAVSFAVYMWGDAIFARFRSS